MTADAPNMTDYDEARESFRLAVPEVFNYARDVVDAWARRDADKLALVAVGPRGDDVQRLTFGDIAERSNRAANFLAAQGVRKGDRIFVMLPRIPQWYDVLMGACKLGAIPMPGTMQLMPKDIQYRISRAEASVAITDPTGAERVDQVAGDCPSLTTRIVVDGSASGWASLEDGMDAASDAAPEAEQTRSDDPMLIYFTSGTTAHPKMVLHTQASYGIGHEITARFWQDLGPDDLHWTVSDTGWAKAAWGSCTGSGGWAPRTSSGTRRASRTST